MTVTAGLSPTIALCIPSIAGGGAERQVLQLAQQLDRSRWRVVLITFDAARHDLDLSTIVIQAAGPARVARLREIIIRERVAVLQTYLVGAQVYGLLAKLLVPDVKLIAAVRSSVNAKEIAGWKGKLSHTAVFSFPKLVDRYVFNSEAADRKLGRSLPPDKRSVIFNGIDVERFRPDSSARNRLATELGLPEGVTIVGIVANVNPYKGYETLVQAAARVAREVPEAHFVAVGEYRNALGTRVEAMVHELSLAQRWHFLGPRDDVEKILPAFDVLCSSSWTEAFSNSIAEAMACQVPCVVTDVGDSAVIVGDTGNVVPPNDAAALSASLAQICSMERGAIRELGQEARRRIVVHFGIARMVADFDQLYARMLGLGSACSS